MQQRATDENKEQKIQQPTNKERNREHELQTDYPRRQPLIRLATNSGTQQLTLKNRPEAGTEAGLSRKNWAATTQAETREGATARHQQGKTDRKSRYTKRPTGELSTSNREQPHQEPSPTPEPGTKPAQAQQLEHKNNFKRDMKQTTTNNQPKELLKGAANQQQQKAKNSKEPDESQPKHQQEGNNQDIEKLPISYLLEPAKSNKPGPTQP